MKVQQEKSGLLGVTRRGFVAGASAVAALGLQAAEEKPILRIGATSDDHLQPEHTETHRRAKACFALFRRMNVDIVVDTGDIANISQVSELACFRRYFDEAFAGTSCVPFFCIANHDYNYVPNTRRNDPKNIENAWRALGMPGPNQSAVVKGYQFVNVFQDEADKGAFAAAVAKAVAANEGNRPVFVVNHVPPTLTTTGTVHWSSPAIREVLDKYPQVVALTGHIHTAISHVANIWQGTFTAINLGAHAYYSNKIDGEAMVLDVFADRIDVRRYEAESGREIGADDRWSIPLPLDPAHGPYRPEVRAKTCPVPTLPDDATLQFTQAAHGQSCAFNFASARPRGSTYFYHITIEAQKEDGSWSFLSLLNWKVPQVMDEPERWTCTFLPTILEPGRPHCVTLTPFNSLEVKGASRTFAFTVPAAVLKVLPPACAQIERFVSSQNLADKPLAVDAAGWLQKKSGSASVVLPKAFTEALREKKTVWIVFDIGSEQGIRPNTFSIGKFSAGKTKVKFVGERIYTLPGRFDTFRYAWKIAADKEMSDDDVYALVIREGTEGRFKINSVTCFAK